MTPHSHGYSRAQVIFHWTIATIVLAVLVTHEDFLATQSAVLHGNPLRTGQEIIRELHLWGGAMVLPLALWRLLVRFRIGVPPSIWGTRAFRSCHCAYACRADAPLLLEDGCATANGISGGKRIARASREKG